ncbi:MAG: histidine phosphatase family protein [Rhodocyclaceae bacterium]|nr:histidine phosphatase family protein [Rhodocyclaceae bacterium]
MDLILWRHAEAEEAVGGVADTKRRLTARGEGQARLMACWLLERTTKKLRILVSPAQRTQMTAHALGLPFEVQPKVGIGADAAELLAAAHWPNHDESVLVVGHKHTLGRAAALLICGREVDWKVKKGALWWFSSRAGEPDARPLLRAVIDPGFLGGRVAASRLSSPESDWAPEAWRDAA